MMYSYPFFPHFYKRPFSRYPYSPTANVRKNTLDTKKKEEFIPKEDTRIEDNKEVLFEIMGIKLHSDDILLLCLIFFLYNEGVKDEFLFIALVLLLLS